MRPVVIRRQLNRWAGLIAGYGLFALAVGLDMLMLRGPDPDDPSWTVADVLLDYGWWVTLLSLFFVTFGARPRVEAWPDRVVVRNLVTDTTIPRAAYVGLTEGFLGWVTFQTTTGSVYAWGLEVLKFEDSPRERDLLPAAFLDSSTTEPLPRHARRVRRRPRRPDWYEVLLWVAWGAYVTLALLFGGPQAPSQ